MKSKFIATVAATLLAGTVYAAAQSGAPSNENDRSGQPTDSSQTSAHPERPAGTQGQGAGDMGGTAGTAGQGPMQDRMPLQPGGVSPSEPPQGRQEGGAAFPQPR